MNNKVPTLPPVQEVYPFLQVSFHQIKYIISIKQLVKVEVSHLIAVVDYGQSAVTHIAHFWRRVEIIDEDVLRISNNVFLGAIAWIQVPYSQSPISGPQSDK